jgi:hypothetical protein
MNKELKEFLYEILEEMEYLREVIDRIEGNIRFEDGDVRQTYYERLKERLDKIEE